MPTLDGKVRFYKAIQDVANGLDRSNALAGTGTTVLFGNVLAGFPDIKVALEGIAQISEEVIALDLRTLLIPDDLRLTTGDRVIMLPIRAERAQRYLVIGKLRLTDLSPVESSRFGYNGDIMNPGSFVGVEVTAHEETGCADSTVAIYGSQIQIQSVNNANVIIDGINFKAHTHTTPSGGGNSGTPH
jgi:hypothetical protein